MSKYRKKKEFVEVFHIDQIDYDKLKELAKFCGKVKFEIVNIIECEPQFGLYYNHGGYIGEAYEGCYLVKQNREIKIFNTSDFNNKYEIDYEPSTMLSNNVIIVTQEKVVK